jgi:hypothetical protein
MQNNIKQHVVTFILGLILLTIGIFGLLYFSHNHPVFNTGIPVVPSSPTDFTGAEPMEKVILTGTQVCLPHKDTTGPQTLECAIGMKTEAGDYYVLDLNLVSQAPADIPNGKAFTASGFITPIEYLNTDQWQKYNVKGIFSVTDLI